MNHPLSWNLSGIRICMLVTNDVSRDTRVRREARALMDAGASVIIIGVGGQGTSDGDLDIRLVSPPAASTASARLVRVAVNIVRTWRFDRRMMRAALMAGADVYHSHDLDTLWAGYHAARRHRAALVYDSHELYLEDAGMAGHWRRPLLARLERRLAPRAHLVITVNDAIADELARRYGIAVPTVVMNGPDRCASAQPVHTPLRVLFQGSYSPGRGVEELVTSMRTTGSIARLTLQGFGVLEGELRRLVRELALEDVVTFTEPCGPDDTASEAARHDVGVVGFTDNALNSRLASPNKFFAYLGGALAVIVPDVPVMSEIVKTNGCGIVVSETSASRIAEAVKWMAEHPAELYRMKQSAARVCAGCGWAQQSENLVSAYGAMLERSHTCAG